MSMRHPAIEAYDKLRLETNDVPMLNFILAQQCWFQARGDASKPPNHRSLMWLRVMAFEFLLTTGFTPDEALGRNVETMERFEKSYVKLFASRLAKAQTDAAIDAAELSENVSSIFNKRK